MVKTKSKILIGIMALILIVSMTACNSSEVGSGNNDKEIIAIDAIDREVKRPESMDRLGVTCRGGATHQLSILGASENIVAQPSVAGFPHLLKMYPRYNEVLDPGSFDEVNVEELLKVETDLVFVGVSSKKGNKLIEDAGIPTFTMFIGTAEIDTVRREFENVGKILGNEKRANELIKYWDKKLEMVEKLVDKVPQNERKKVHYSGNQITNVSGGKGWGHSLIVGSGGIDIADEIIKGGKGSEVSVEQIIGWDPDVIVTQKRPEGTASIINDERIQDLDVIKNNEVYSFPIGGFWWDRPSPEAPLGFMWLAKTLYPEYTKGIDLKKETKEFYSTFYDYQLSDEEYESFF